MQGFAVNVLKMVKEISQVNILCGDSPSDQKRLLSRLQLEGLFQSQKLESKNLKVIKKNYKNEVGKKANWS